MLPCYYQVVRNEHMAANFYASLTNVSISLMSVNITNSRQLQQFKMLNCKNEEIMIINLFFCDKLSNNLLIFCTNTKVPGQYL